MIFMSGRKSKFFSSLLFSSSALASDPVELEMLLKQQIHNQPEFVEVSTANRILQSSSQASQVTYIVTADDIERLNLRTLGEILTLFPGMYASSDSTFGYLTSRGIGRPGDYNSRLLFLIDGTRVNDNIYDAGLIGSNFVLDTRLIERVEYSPGTGSALYGNNAYLGVINIISKKVNELQGSSLFVMTTDRHQHDFLGAFGYRHESGHEGYFAFSQNLRENIQFPDLAVAPDLQLARNSNTDENTKFAGNYTFRRFSLDFAAVQRDRVEPNLTIDGRIENSLIQNDTRYLAARYSHRLTNNFEWFSHLSTNQMRFKTVNPTRFPGSTIPASLIFDVKGDWFNLDQRFSFHRNEQQDWLIGFDLQRDYRQTYRYSIDELFTLSGSSSDNFRYGLFVNHEWQLVPKHRLITGIRYDHSAQNVREFSPKLGWIWQLSERNQLRFNYGRAFRAPNEYELETNRFYHAELPLSEQITTFEIAWQKNWQDNWHHTLSVYQNKLENLITANFGSTTLVQFFNDQPVTARGFEITAQKHWNDLSELSVSLSLQKAEYQNNQRLTNAPEHMLKLNYHLPLWTDTLTANYRLFVASKRYGVLTDQAGFARHDVVVSWLPAEDLTVQIGIKNFTDHRYSDAPLPSAVSLMQAARVAELSVHWSFN